jgi:hypothetical protein
MFRYLSDRFVRGIVAPLMFAQYGFVHAHVVKKMLSKIGSINLASTSPEAVL